VIAYTGPFWPLFLHVLGAMLLFGAVLAAVIAGAAGHRAAQFKALLVAVPMWVLMRGGAAWTYSHGYSAVKSQTWLKLGMNVADGGLIVLLLAIGTAYWSQRASSRRATRIAAALGGVYLVLLAFAWIAMSGKWG
jgi:hypothetical protein